MTRFELDLNPVSHISADAIGAPGQRVFYIQAWHAERPQPVTIILEKIQLQSLTLGAEKMLAELEKKMPELKPAGEDFDADRMQIMPPLDPLFRAGEIGLGYDDASDLMVILAKEMVVEDGSAEDASEVRFWCTRTQVRRMARWSKEVINRGRPLCPQCGQPMETDGHFCPKKNGHKH